MEGYSTRRCPTSWRGSELQHNPSWIWFLTAPEAGELVAAMRQVRTKSAHIQTMTKADFLLPTLAGKLAQLQAEVEDGRGFALVRGIPIDGLTDEEIGTIYWGIGLHMGRAIAQNAQGDTLGHVRDLGRDGKRDFHARGYQTTMRLAFHNDSADIVGLLCLRTAKSGGCSYLVKSRKDGPKRRPHLPPPNSGAVIFNDIDLSRLDREALRRQRQRLQMVFQDPISSLNPRRRISDIVAEPLLVWGGLSPEQIRTRVNASLELVGLVPDHVWNRKPHEFSGGQCQRISLARAVVTQPELLVCDEPVSALDVSVQAQVLNLLHDMKERLHLTMIFISHDLAAVKNIADRVAVMYLGKIVEIAPTEAIYRQPRHHYTVALMESVLTPEAGLPDRDVVVGEIPSALDPPSGCRFRTRCPRAQRLCAEVEPPLQGTDGHLTACHFPLSWAVSTDRRNTLS